MTQTDTLSPEDRAAIQAAVDFIFATPDRNQRRRRFNAVLVDFSCRMVEAEPEKPESAFADPAQRFGQALSKAMSERFILEQKTEGHA